MNIVLEMIWYIFMILVYVELSINPAESNVEQRQQPKRQHHREQR